MDSGVQITLIICLTIVIVYGMSLIKEYLTGAVENTNDKNLKKLIMQLDGVRYPDTSSGEALKNIKPPKTGSGIKDTSRVDKVFRRE